MAGSIAPSLFSPVPNACIVGRQTPAGGTRERNSTRPVVFTAACRCAVLLYMRQTGRQYDEHSARPHVPRFAKTCHGSAAGELRLHRAAQPGRFEAGRACRDRRQAGFLKLRQSRSHRDDAQQGRRISSFRLERLLVVAVAADRACLPRTPLSHHPRHALVPHLYRRHQAGSDQGGDTQDHRARGNFPEDRIFAAPHRSLRTGRHLHLDARRRRQERHRWTSRRLHHGLRDLRGARAMGARSRSANPAL